MSRWLSRPNERGTKLEPRFFCEASPSAKDFASGMQQRDPIAVNDPDDIRCGRKALM